MKQILRENDQVKIVREGDRVIKEYTMKRNHIDTEWLSHYQGFSNMFGGVVKVYEADPNHIVMDYVKGHNLKSMLWNNNGPMIHMNHQFSYRCFAAILQSLANMAEFSSMIKSVWFHDDAGTHNFMYTKKGFILIDPDAFSMQDNPYPGTFVSSLHPLHDILSVIHTMNRIRYEINSKKKEI